MVLDFVYYPSFCLGTFIVVPAYLPCSSAVLHPCYPPPLPHTPFPHICAPPPPTPGWFPGYFHTHTHPTHTPLPFVLPFGSHTHTLPLVTLLRCGCLFTFTRTPLVGSCLFTIHTHTHTHFAHAALYATFTTHCGCFRTFTTFTLRTVCTLLDGFCYSLRWFTHRSAFGRLPLHYLSGSRAVPALHPRNHCLPAGSLVALPPHPPPPVPRLLRVYLPGSVVALGNAAVNNGMGRRAGRRAGGAGRRAAGTYAGEDFRLPHQQCSHYHAAPPQRVVTPPPPQLTVPVTSIYYYVVTVLV